ncbi:MAG: hypothetical protein DI539_28350, partial [Flavobacterium psychrophilum]
NTVILSLSKDLKRETHCHPERSVTEPKDLYNERTDVSTALRYAQQDRESASGQQYCHPELVEGSQKRNTLSS